MKNDSSIPFEEFASAVTEQATVKPDLCHHCQFGGEVVERCSCPDLKQWQLLKRDWTNADLIGRAKGLAEAKGITDFNPLRYIAPIVATSKGLCQYYRKA